MTTTDIRSKAAWWAPALLLATLAHCDNQASTNPASFIEASSAATTMTATAVTTPAGHVQALVDDVLKASPVKEVLAELSPSGPCSAQQSALDALVSNYVKQVDATGIEPDASALNTFMEQVQTNLQGVVNCACSNGYKSPVCP